MMQDLGLMNDRVTQIIDQLYFMIFLEIAKYAEHCLEMSLPGQCKVRGHHRDFPSRCPLSPTQQSTEGYLSKTDSMTPHWPATLASHQVPDNKLTEEAYQS